MQRSDYFYFDLADVTQVAALKDQYNLHAVSGRANRVYIHPEVRLLAGSLNFGGDGNEVFFGEACSFHGEIVSMGTNAKTIIHGGQHALALQAFVYSGAILEIGSGTTAYGLRTWVSEEKTLNIGENCLFSEGITIRTTDHHSIFDLDTEALLNRPANVTICDRVWIGQDVAILKGVTIGSGSIIGAKALVNRSVPEKELWSGAPARMIRQRVSWLDPHPATQDQIRARIQELGA